MTYSSQLNGGGQPSTNRLTRSTHAGILIMVLVGSAVALSPGGADPDLWGHIRYGQDVFAEGLADTATYTYTAEGYRWINHENLSELWFATADHLAGAWGLQATRFVIALLTVGLLAAWMFSQGVELIVACAVITMVTLNLMHHWSIRPQLFTYMFFTLEMLMLEIAFRGWAGNWHLPWPRKAKPKIDLAELRRQVSRLWLCVPLFFVWANTHGGFVAGICIFAAVLAVRCVELFCQFGWQARATVARLALIGLAALAATLINPYSFRLHLWLLESLQVPRPEITEWHGLAWDQGFTWLFLALLAAFVIGYGKSRRQLDATRLLVLAIVSMQAIEHRRHIAFAAILGGLWLPMIWQIVWDQARTRFAPIGSAPAESPNVQHADAAPPAWVRCLVGIGCVAVLVAAGWKVSRLGVPRDVYPVDAIEFMAEHRLSGKLMVAFNWAQYALAAAAAPESGLTDTRVAFDGRFRTCYPQEVIDMHFDLLLGRAPGKRHRSPDSPPFQPARILRYDQPDLVLLDRKQPHSIQTIRQLSDEWVLLYQDGIAQLWGRRDRYDDPASTDYFARSSRRITDRTRTEAAAWPAFPIAGQPGGTTGPSDVVSGGATRFTTAPETGTAPSTATDFTRPKKNHSAHESSTTNRAGDSASQAGAKP